jgi:hypothetical protein
LDPAEGRVSAIWLTFEDLSYLLNRADLLNVEMIYNEEQRYNFDFGTV